MKLKTPTLLVATLTLLATACVTQPKLEGTPFVNEGNPLVRHKYTADPTARVFDDRLYVYTSHDADDAEYFYMIDWALFSTDDMTNWLDHGTLFSLDDITWADEMAWAPDCIERDGKYYLYYPVERTKIGVAVSDRPTGGFVDSGAPLIDNTDQVELMGPEPIDPTTIIVDGQAYIYFGCREFRWAKLDKSMTKLASPVQKMEIIGIEGDKENYGGFYGEGPFIFVREGLYYMVYSNGWGKNSTLVYATSTTPEGPFTFRGEVMPPMKTGTSHGSMVEFKGQWYVFYHTNQLSGKGYRRSIAFDKIDFNEDGTIIPATTTSTYKREK